MVVAQAIQENGWKINKAPGQNLFNIKGKGSAGSIIVTTHEEDADGNREKIKDKFRAYNSMDEAINDYINLIKKNYPDAYEALTNENKTVEDFTAGLKNGKKGPYATDADYDTQIKTLYKQVKREYGKYVKEGDSNEQAAEPNEKKSKTTNQKPLGPVDNIDLKIPDKVKQMSASPPSNLT